MMGYTWCIGVAVLGCLAVHIDSLKRGDCSPNKLTVYRVVMKTSWSRELFPKQYPKWRPPAQWSKLIGRSHDFSYSLFHVGKRATEGIKEFAEAGSTAVLDAESQGEGGIFDEFNAPPVTTGVGDTGTEFFVDGNHSLVSVAAKVIPSPDWFVGVDAFNLCVNGNWIDSVLLEMAPLDAGTDNGFTFTSPNWPSIPGKPISEITSQYPNHPANSFYYKDRKQHPPFASFHIVKIKEYELSKVFDPKIATKPFKVSKDRFPTETSKRFELSNDILPIDEIYSSKERQLKHEAIDHLLRKYKKKHRKNRKGRKSSRRLRSPRHCKVNKWGNWSPCTKTCGIGEQVRERKILKHSRRGGRACPHLTERKWCGSSRDCDKKYFDW